MKVKYLIERLQKFDPESNIFFALDDNLGEGYSTVSIKEIDKNILVDVLHKAKP